MTIGAESREALTRLGPLSPDAELVDEWSGSYADITGQPEKDDPRNVVAHERIISDDGT